MKQIAKIFVVSSLLSMLTIGSVNADKYVVDSKGMHAFVQFRVKHLGYSWLYGRFNNFTGEFNFDEKDAAANSIKMAIDTTSLDTNHAERDKHIRSSDFLNTSEFPQASFESTQYSQTGDNTAVIKGNLTLHGVTKEISITVEQIGGGPDPWGGYRQGFEGRANIQPDDFGITMVKRLGPAAGTVELLLSVEGIRQ